MVNTDNTSNALTRYVVEQIQTLEPLTDVIREEGVYKVLHDPQTGNVVGDIRVLQGSKLIDNVIIVHIMKESMQLDAYMVAAFTRPGSLYPHLVFDSEWLPNDSAFHIDLLHKKDTSIDLDYISEILEPMTPAFDKAKANENFRFSDATKLMCTLLNPWMVSYHCLPEHLDQSREVIESYTQYWLSLINKKDGIRFDGEDRAEYAAYDKAHRFALFNPKVDILWDMLVNIVGADSRDLILSLLQGK